MKMSKNKINNMQELAQEERSILRKRADEAMQKGIRVRDPERIDIRGELICGSNVEIDINVVIEGKVILGDDVRIGANCILINSSIGSASTINPYSLVEDSVIGKYSFVGPYGRVRPKCELGDHVQIGNFVEIKNATVASGCRINHLTFVGDANLAKNVTLGAGTTTCNHDGVNTNSTIIEEGAYVGSGSNLIAPLSIGANATIGSGSTITDDVPEGQLTLARSRQVTVKNWKRPKGT